MLSIGPEKLILYCALFGLPILPNLWAIWHIFRSDFATAQEKLAWLGAAVFLPVLGGVTYIILGRKRGTRVV